MFSDVILKLIIYFNELIINIVERLLIIIISLIIIMQITKILIFFINKSIYKIQKSKGTKEDRIKTITGLIDNLIKYAMYIIIIITSLILFGIPWESLLAGAGVLGVIIGIGAKELITDTINGFFVIFENTYDVGDYIQISNNEGYVEELGIKSTVLKTFENKMITIPNSQIREVINYSKENHLIFYDFSASYNNTVAEIETLIDEKISPEVIKIQEVKDCKYIGINEFLDSAVAYRLVISTNPEDRFRVTRKTNKIIKEIFDENKFEIPYPNITINHNKDNNVI